MPPIISGETAYPIFATRNWLSKETIDYGTFTASEMQALLHRVLDGDRYSYWQGETFDDAVSVVIQMSLQMRTAQVYRPFNLVILQNINWKHFLGEYFDEDASAWVTITGLDYREGTAANAAADIIVALPASVSGNEVRFTVDKTIIADEAKRVGNIIVCESVVQLSSGFLDYKPGYNENVNRLKMGDGSQFIEYSGRSAASHELWKASFDAPYATLAELLLLRAIKRGGLPFILIPEPANRPDEAYQCIFDGAWPGHAYQHPIRELGYLIPLRVIEVGKH